MTKILIDMQACQTESRLRGMGRYAAELAFAMASTPRGHNVHLLLNGCFPAEAETVQARFSTVMPPGNIHVFEVPDNSDDRAPQNRWRNAAAALLRESFIDRLTPDIVFCPSFFEGYIDNSVLSIGRLSDIPVAVTLHDLIPLVYAQNYLEPNPDFRTHYLTKTDEIRRARGVITISQASFMDAVNRLGIDAGRIVDASEAADPMFRPLSMSQPEKDDIAGRYGLRGPFIFYTGGCDPRKNLSRLIASFAMLRSMTGPPYQLVLAGSMPTPERDTLKGEAAALGMGDDIVLFPGYVNDTDLVRLYNLAELFVFPSLYEGFGLPCLEAMQCGTPVLAANASSLPEVISMPAAMFDPLSVPAMALAMAHVLTDTGFHRRLVAHGLQRARHFSWSRSAAITLDSLAAWAQAGPSERAPANYPDHEAQLAAALARIPPRAGRPSDADLAGVATILAEMARPPADKLYKQSVKQQATAF
ncbi:MAG: glycosyltransferase family 4 protein [Agrobacterium sp.]|nr:glycosyltransferase family 4 protein [Agrobacterium sp.]